MEPLAFLKVSPHRCRCVEQLAAVSGFYCVLNVCIAGSHGNLLFFPTMLESLYCTSKCNMKEFPSRFMTLGVVSFLFMVSGEVQLCTNSKGWTVKPPRGLWLAIGGPLSLNTNFCTGWLMHRTVWTVLFISNLTILLPATFPLCGRFDHGWASCDHLLFRVCFHFTSISFFVSENGIRPSHKPASRMSTNLRQPIWFPGTSWRNSLAMAMVTS